MLTALIGVVGVVVGAVLTGMIGLYRDRAQEGASLEGSIRLLAIDLVQLDSLIQRSLDDGVARFSKTDVARTTDSWLAGRALLARKLDKHQWAIIARVFQTALVWEEEDGRKLDDHDEKVLREWLARLEHAQNIFERWRDAESI